MAGGAYAVPVEGPSLFLLSKTPLNMLMKFPKTPGLLGWASIPALRGPCFTSDWLYLSFALPFVGYVGLFVFRPPI